MARVTGPAAEPCPCSARRARARPSAWLPGGSDALRAARDADDGSALLDELDLDVAQHSARAGSSTRRRRPCSARRRSTRLGALGLGVARRHPDAGELDGPAAPQPRSAASSWFVARATPATSPRWARASPSRSTASTRGAALLALETIAGLLGDDARRRARPRAARDRRARRDGRAGGADARTARRARGRRSRRPACPRSRPERDGVWEVEVERGVVAARSRATPARASCSCTSSPTTTGRSDVETCCAGCWGPATGAARGSGSRRCRAATGVFAACAVPPPASSRRRWPGASSRCCGSPTSTTTRRAGMSVEMFFTIAFFALLVVGYFYAVGKVWRGESQFDARQPAVVLAVQPRAVAGHRPRAPGPGRLRAGPDRRRHRRPTSIGKDSRVLRHRDERRPRRPARDVFSRFPIMYYNRPRFLVPPHLARRPRRGRRVARRARPPLARAHADAPVGELLDAAPSGIAAPSAAARASLMEAKQIRGCAARVRRAGGPSGP